MKEKMVSWFKAHPKLRIAIPSIAVAMVLLVTFVPIYADWSASYPDVEGTYLVSSGDVPKEMDNDRHPKIKFGQLVITTQSDKLITSAYLEHLGLNIDLDGIVGPGTRPSIYLYGTDSDGSYVHIQGKVKLNGAGEVTNIIGKITGLVTSDGERYEDSADGTSATSAVSYHSQPLSCLLTGGTLASPESLLFHNPVSSLRLSQLTTLIAGKLGFWYNLENAKTPGPQMMLRFAPKGSVTQSYYGGGTSGLVDISIMPYQGTTGDGTWKECRIDKDTVSCVYAGNDPTDYTAFSMFTGGHALSEMEALINAEAAMTAGGDSASDWVLTMVSVELWEGGARTCYIDDVTIGSQLYTLEPNSYSGSFKAKIVE